MQFEGDLESGAIRCRGLEGCEPAGVSRFFGSEFPVRKHAVIVRALSRSMRGTRGTGKCRMGRLKLLSLKGEFVDGLWFGEEQA